MSTARISVFATFALGASALAGCAETCPPPQTAFEGATWDVFGRIIALDQEPAPEFPAGSHPLNGLHTWTIGWAESGLDSPVTVTIDEQVFEGKGVYDDVECGNFSVAFQGTYAAPDGAEHLLGATARLIVFDDTLDGFVNFQGSWVTADDDQGTVAGSAQLSDTQDESSTP